MSRRCGHAVSRLRLTCRR